ncbi:hypothetical protein FHS57_001201 [Runella defluvii]|uniref:LamG-like jellyroll fold domain-containing protein n=1 Tax=Runella defluvii TaxID=370973 RepID=A0A7W5ZJU1_9BACT|nr:LamG domain-containing protein [Runella defluvii]MBB3837207.1 hypothetical protein [Runella defluvii]
MKRYITILFLFLGLIQAQGQKRTYEYDDLNRLSKVYVYNGGTLTHTVTYNYDEMGNRLSKVVSSSTTPTQTIAISSPTGGTFTAGQSVTVTYASTGGTGNVSLELVSCSGSVALAVISVNAAASGSTNYTLPNNLTTGQYRIKAYVTGTSAEAYYGTCFTVNAIATQSIAINSPVSGTFTAGQTVSVSYASTNGSANVSLELVNCAGTTALAVIADNVAASGSTNYILPSTLTAGSYRIKSYLTGTSAQAFYGTCFTVNASSGGDCPPTISHSGNITANMYNASQTIVSTANVPNNTKYYAGQSVTLSPGFSAGPNENFEIRVQGCNTTTNGLVAYYPFNGTANDESGSGNHGTQQGGVNFTTATDRFGVAGKAAGFDGVDDYINLGNKISTFGGQTPFSISLWVSNITNKQGDYLSRYNQLVKGEFLISNGESGIFFHREVSPWQLVSNRILDINKWYMISCVYDGLKAFIYIDGQKVAEDLRGSSDTALLTNVLIGAKYKTDVVGDFINSKLDEIRLYNRAITDAEVLQIYNAEKP